MSRDDLAHGVDQRLFGAQRKWRAQHDLAQRLCRVGKDQFAKRDHAFQDALAGGDENVGHHASFDDVAQRRNGRIDTRGGAKNRRRRFQQTSDTSIRKTLAAKPGQQVHGLTGDGLLQVCR